jgi:adenosine kinase
MPVALICGSLAYDTIMVFQDQFKNHILPDKVHILNVSFLVPRMRREFGGCAGNIAYNLKLLGGSPMPMATVGQDFGPYREHFQAQGIPLDRVKELGDLYTAQAFITTDLDDNQITAFHPGAMMRSYENHVKDVPDVGFGIVGPDGYEAMLQNSQEFAEVGIPFIFDPGQAMPLYNGKELTQMIEQATYVTVNDYESSLLQDKTGLSREADRRARAGLPDHARAEGLGGAHQGRHAADPGRHRDARGRPDRLRRRLPRRPDLRLDARHGHGHHRAASPR